jgi:CHAT domain-containing protein
MVTVVTEHEVVYLQSASMLAALQNKKEMPNTRQKEIVILADPVFSQDDPRVTSEAKQIATQSIPETTDLRRSLRDIDGQGGEVNFSRLLSTLQEARMIVKAAPRGSTEVITGFEANKSSSMNATLGQARILHFATHGIINNEHPELSGIVLSLVDPKGNARSGFLRLSDIYKLNLQCDLVVLSACRSGLGKQLNGEGFVGLTRGFTSAGSRSVIASLWKVDDEATAELMGHFYEAMFRQGLTPAAALQKAKLTMQSDPTWHHPYYWAGFILQGEYREKITIEGSSKTNVILLIALAIGLAVSAFFLMRQMTRRQGWR